MENADTYDAPLPAGDGKATTWPEIIPPLADDEASKQLHDALSSVQPSKDPSVISAKPSSAAMDAYKRHFVHFLSVLKSTEKTDNSNNNNNTNNGNSNNSSNINSNNKEPAMALLVQTLDQLMPTLPPTPEVEDGDPQTLLQPDSAVAEEDLRHMLIAMAAAGYPRDMTEAAYNISNLASTENFGSLMTTAAELREKHPSPNGATSGLTTDALALLFQQKTDGLQPEQQQQQQQQSSMAYHQHRDLAAALAVQDDGQLPVSLQPQDYASLFASATFSPHDDTHLQCKSPAAAPFGQQNTVNHYISPASLDRSNPAGNGDLSLLSAIAPAALGHRRATSANSEQNGLPSPLTQASSNHSEAPQSPPSMLGLSGVPVVICPLHDPDGRSCGKRCSGAKPYRSIQEHIRRAHPDRYIAGLPANEESFQAMVNTEGVICPIPHSDGSPCGTRCTGSKPYRSIQDHIRDTHPEHFVPNLPANEASFRIMVEKPETISCPLLMPDGSTCPKRCFGDKRFRSIQEHIRRAHPERYISGLSANEESFLRMTSGLVPAKHASQQTAITTTAQAAVTIPTTDRTDSGRRDSSLSTQAQKPADLSPVMPRRADSLTEAFEASTLRSSQPELSSPFEQPVWAAPMQQTTGTVAPEMLMTRELQPAPTDYTPFSFNPQPLQRIPAFQQAHFPNPPYSAMANATPALLDSDPTLSRDLFDSQSLYAPVQTLYGIDAGLKRLASEQASGADSRTKRQVLSSL